MNKRIRISLICLAIVFIIAAVTCCPMGRRVTLRTRDGRILYACRIPSGEKAWILYTHSVNKGLVEDGYEPTDAGLILRCSRFRQYGAGIPEPEAGQTFKDCGEYYEISGFDYEMDTQWTFVGRVADHRLRVGEDGPLVHYDQLAQPGTALGLSSDSWSILKEIEWRCRLV